MSEIANSPLDKLASIRGFDEDIATELQQRAIAYINAKKEEIAKLCKQNKVDTELMNYELLSPELLEVLVKAGLQTLTNLGELSTDELMEIAGDLLTETEAKMLIMKIRETW